jgi:hypothetical protein
MCASVAMGGTCGSCRFVMWCDSIVMPLGSEIVKGFSVAVASGREDRLVD